MRAFACPVCANVAHFDNRQCVHCGSALGFRWPEREIDAVGEADAPCANAALAACNWLVAAPGALCASCALTTTRPADDDPAGLQELRSAEAAKRRLLFELGELGLPVEGLSFELLSSTHVPVATGHADGVITLDLAESDDSHREALRQQLREPYRTVLGHFRHEVGHFFQTVLLEEGTPAMERCRELFGDEREDYAEAMQRHYEHGSPTAWQQSFVSAYATMHPWEDWAETFAHLLHVRDAMQTAAAYGLTAQDPGVPMRELLAAWTPLSIALNALNRSMGLGDLYPFVLTGPVVEKLAFVDEVVAAGTRGSPAAN